MLSSQATLVRIFGCSRHRRGSRTSITRPLSEAFDDFALRHRQGHLCLQCVDDVIGFQVTFALVVCQVERIGYSMFNFRSDITVCCLRDQVEIKSARVATAFLQVDCENLSALGLVW